MLSPEYKEFIDFGSKIGATIEQRLGVRMAALTHPVDLALIGLAVYAQDQISPRLRGNPSYHAQGVAGTYSSQIFARAEIDKGQFIRGYPELIAKDGQYAKGKIATAIREAGTKLTEEETLALESYLGRLAALFFVNEPEQIPKPEVRMNHFGGQTVFDTYEVELYRGGTPGIIVEYGPGVNAFGRFNKELRPIRLSILIERSNYVNSLLYSGSSLFGYSNRLDLAPGVITRRDGISQATAEMLKGGFSGFVDVVLMSMVHSAGESEIRAGIANGYSLLRKGGAIIAQSPYDPLSEDECSGRVMLEVLKSKFGDGSPYMHFIEEDARFIQQTTGRTRAGFKAVFIK